MLPTNPSHFVLLPFPYWGHVRPVCALATRLVREQANIVVTFIAAPHMLDKIRTEVSRQFPDESLECLNALQRIRILSPHQSNSDSKDPMKILLDGYPAAYKTLFQAQPITCSLTGTTFDAVPAPCAAIIDFFNLAALRATRAISGHSVPIITWVASGAAAIIRLFGPESMGGMGDFGARTDAEVARTGLPVDDTAVDEIADEIYNHTEGKLVEIPGLPAMHDYEFFPQLDPVPKDSHRFLRGGYDSFRIRECDATILTTFYNYESVSLDAMKEWFASMHRELHILGPILPVGYGAETQKTEEGAGGEIEAFLEEMLIQHGKRSVFFVSFGTGHWPSVTGYVDETIEALIEKNAPFIFSSASSQGQVSEQLAEKIKSSGLGVLSAWSPQQLILNHPATGWFVSHAGFGSVIESLASGIPLICWPITADQPAAAAHVTENLKAAFELFQVRTGDGLRRIHRNRLTPEGTREAVGVEVRHTIDLCRGEKGQELRKNAEEFKVKFAKAWDDNGNARKEMRRFLHTYTKV